MYVCIVYVCCLQTTARASIASGDGVRGRAGSRFGLGSWDWDRGIGLCWIGIVGLGCVGLGSWDWAVCGICFFDDGGVGEMGAEWVWCGYGLGCGCGGVVLGRGWSGVEGCVVAYVGSIVHVDFWVGMGVMGGVGRAGGRVLVLLDVCFWSSMCRFHRAVVFLQEGYFGGMCVVWFGQRHRSFGFCVWGLGKEVVRCVCSLPVGEGGSSLVALDHGFEARLEFCAIFLSVSGY